MNETKNYLKEYYSKREEIDLRELAKNVEQNSNEKTIKELKRTILRLQNEIDKENTKLHKEMDKSYSENYTPTKNRIVLEYRSKNGLKYFDIDNGLATELEDTDIKYCIDTKVGNVSIIVGYNFDLASIIIKTYKYSINTDNTQLTLKPLEINVVSFMENKGIRINISNGIITETNGNTNWYGTYTRISGKEFIDKFYGTDYKGTIPLIALRNYNLKNKAFEIIIKSAPQETKDLQKEGDTLNHCVASYIKRVVENQCLIYFLRTNKEESLITFEVRNNAIVQVKGKHNRKPSDSEVLALQEFAKARGLETRF